MKMPHFAFSLLAACLFICCSTGCQSKERIYPPCPFEHVLEGFPEIIPLRDEPMTEDKEAFDAYWEQQTAIFERSLNETIMANAPQRERDLFSACQDGRNAEARKLADDVLSENPDSLIGLYAIAQVEAFAENDLAYALNSIRRARRQAEEMGKLNPRDPIGQEWYVRTLWVEWTILDAMDRSEDIVILAKRIEKVYSPVPWLTYLAYIKLERFDEARAEIQKMKETGNFDLIADNAVMMIEDKQKSRELSLSAARKMCERFPNQRVLQKNLGTAAMSNASFGEAEQAFIASTASKEGLINSTPFIPLAALLVQQGRFSEALDAAKKAQADRGDREPHTLSFDEANTNLTIATVLLAYNESDLAMRFAQRATESPDRAASQSGSQVDLRISDGLILWTIQKYKREELEEQLSIGSVPSLSSLARIASIQASMWTTKQKFLSELSHSRIVDIIAPYKPGGVGTEVQSWHRFMLLDLVPLGVLELAAAEAERVDRQPWIPPYLQALRAGIRLRTGNYSEALRLANQALVELPARAEKVLRAFVEAIAGQAAWQLGKSQEAIGHWTVTLRDFPQAFRLLDIQIPLRLANRMASNPATQTNKTERAITSTLASSSRFFEAEEGCEVIVRPFGNNQLLIEMFRNDRSRHMELVVDMVQVDGFVETTVDQFHKKFFQPLVELTQGDLGSLDGSPVAARLRRDVDELFSDFILPEGVSRPTDSGVSETKGPTNP